MVSETNKLTTKNLELCTTFANEFQYTCIFHVLETDKHFQQSVRKTYILVSQVSVCLPLTVGLGLQGTVNEKA